MNKDKDVKGTKKGDEPNEKYSKKGLYDQALDAGLQPPPLPPGGLLHSLQGSS